MIPFCDVCKIDSVLVTGKVVYPHRPDLADKKIYRCPSCGARVGCHPGTTKPLGNLVGAQERTWRMAAHEAFDKTWKTKRWGNRQQAYAKLAEFMALPPEKCHIGMFTVEQCKMVVEVCE